MEISINDILAIVKKNITLIIIIPIIFAIGAYGYTSIFVDKTYRTSVKLYVETDYSSSSSYDDLQSYNYAGRLVNTYIQMLDTNNFYSAVSETLDNRYTASQLSKMVKFTPIEDTELFRADVVTTDPNEAKAVADAVAKTAPVTISQLNKNAQLKTVDDAVVPLAPSSPNIAQNVVIAFCMGFVIALIAAFIRDYFDVKIKYDDDMTTLCDFPILAAIPDFDYFVNSEQKNAKSGHNKSRKN